VLPAASVTVQVTAVTPAAKVVDVALLVTEATPQLSAVAGEPRLTPVAVQPVLVAVLMSAGQVMVGRTLSLTVTVWVQEAALPAASVTVQVTAVTPAAKVVDVTLLLTEATPQLSNVVGSPRSTPVAVQPVLVVALTSAGQVMVGARLSVTVTVWVHEALFLSESKTVQRTGVTPNGKAAGAFETGRPSDGNEKQLSAVKARPRLTPVAVQPLVLVTAAVKSGGQVILGSSLSLTVTG
jgi:hypothetical protein